MELNANSWVGKPLSELEASGMEYRIDVQDGVSFILTMDYDEFRLNVEVENGIIVAARYG